VFPESRDGNILGLNVNTPGLVFEVESLESTLLAENFEFVDNLVSSVVTSTGKTLRVPRGDSISELENNLSGLKIIRKLTCW